MTQLTIPNTAVPAHLRNRAAKTDLTGSVAGGLTTGTAFPKFSLKGSRFRIMKDGTEQVLDTLKLPTVIVGGNPRVSKQFYKDAYDGNAEAKAPDCYSINGVRPEADSKAMQADMCANCPQNAWGSKIGPQGQKLKACADKKRLAIVAADAPEDDIYLLEVTPSAFKDFAQYIKQLSSRGFALETVVTNMSFDSTASFPKLTFAFGGFLDEETQDAVDRVLDNPLIQEITGDIIPPAPVQQQAAKPMLVQAAPAPVEEAEYEEVAPAPAKKAFGGSVAAPAPAAAPAAAPAKKAFGATAAPAAAPAAAKKAKAPPMEEPAAASGTALADEISALLGGLSMDD